MTLRTYSELIKRDSHIGRFRYLSLDGEVGQQTFGQHRYLNQAFYNSAIWRQARDLTIIRDHGRDLGLEGHEIHGRILVHHMNPIVPADFEPFNPDIVNPEYLISVCELTHNAIHFGDETLLPRGLVIRQPGDTKLW